MLMPMPHIIRFYVKSKVKEEKQEFRLIRAKKKNFFSVCVSEINLIYCCSWLKRRTLAYLRSNFVNVHLRARAYCVIINIRNNIKQ